MTQFVIQQGPLILLLVPSIKNIWSLNCPNGQNYRKQILRKEFWTDNNIISHVWHRTKNCKRNHENFWQFRNNSSILTCTQNEQMSNAAYSSSIATSSKFTKFCYWEWCQLLKNSWNIMYRVFQKECPNFFGPTYNFNSLLHI